MPEVQVNGLTYAYERHGQGPALIVLHGFTGSAANWAEVAAPLSRTNEVVCVDLLGHGRTAAPPDPQRYQMPAAAADVVGLCDLLGIPRANLLGYSMGGRLALYLALHFPQRWERLILESSSPGLASAAARQERQTADELLAERILEHGVPAFVDQWEQLALFASQAGLPAARRTRLRAQRLGNNPLGLANSLRGMGSGRQPSLWTDLPSLSTPTLLLAGALDEKFVALNREMAARMPAATLEVIEAAGHTIHLEQPGRYMTAVSGFLAGLDQDALR